MSSHIFYVYGVLEATLSSYVPEAANVDCCISNRPYPPIILSDMLSPILNNIVNINIAIQSTIQYQYCPP